MKWVILIVVFFLLGAFFIISNNNLHLGNSTQRHEFISQYYDWFFKIGENVKNVAGYVIKTDWMP